MVEEKTTLGEGRDQSFGGERFMAPEDHFLGRLLAGTGNLGVAQSGCGCEDLRLPFVEASGGQSAEAGLDRGPNLILVGEPEFDEVIETAV